MSNENAPFYEGQKVVGLRTARSTAGGYELIKGNVYTVVKCSKCSKCGEWNVSLSELAYTGNGSFASRCVECSYCYISHSHCQVSSEWIAPINPYSSDATKELVENLEEKLGDYADQPVKKVVFNN